MLTKDDLTAIRGIVKEEVRTEVVQVVKKELKPIHQKLNKLDKKIDLIARALDSDIVDLQKRTNRVEEHLHLSPLN